jgi:hypothetical protein
LLVLLFHSCSIRLINNENCRPRTRCAFAPSVTRISCNTPRECRGAARIPVAPRECRGAERMQSRRENAEVPRVSSERIRVEQRENPEVPENLEGSRESSERKWVQQRENSEPLRESRAADRTQRRGENREIPRESNKRIRVSKERIQSHRQNQEALRIQSRQQNPEVPRESRGAKRIHRCRESRASASG